MLKDLKAFLMRPNILELAVAVVIAAAFGLIVASFVENLINPLIGLIFGQPDLSAIALRVGEGDDATVFGFGAFLNTVINFIIVGTVLFFVMKAAEKAMERRKKEEEVVVEADPEELTLLRDIRDALTTTVPQPPKA